MVDEREPDRRDTHAAFSSAFQKDAFQTENKTFFGALSLTFAGVVYTAVIAVVGVAVAMLPVQGAVRLIVAVAYVVLSVGLFSWGVTWGRRTVIRWSRRLLELPRDQG